MSKKLTGDYIENTQYFDKAIRLSENFDLVGREIKIASRYAKMYFVQAFVKDLLIEELIEFIDRVTEEDMKNVLDTRDFCSKFVSYTQTNVESDIDTVVTSVLSGALAMIVEGFEEIIILDARTYPMRSLSEPDNDKVLKGSHDGFTETLVINTALIRRRLRSPNFITSFHQIGDKSKTDIVVCYLDDVVNRKHLRIVTDRLKTVKADSLAMSHQSLLESLLPKQWYNPFPKIRYTERPDTATASIIEGNIIILVDNSPVAMLVSTSFFDFVQEANDFYFPSLIGSYLKGIRIFIFFMCLFLTPVWYLLIRNPDYIPWWLDFIRIKEYTSVPVILQLLVIEVVIDALKMASLNTPSALSNSFSVVGALVLGDLAINVEWFVPEVVLYMAFVAIATFAQSSFELGYAFKFLRLILLILTAIFNLWGFIAALVITFLLLVTTQTLTGRNYLYPVIPFNKDAFMHLFFKKPIKKSKT